MITAKVGFGPLFPRSPVQKFKKYPGVKVYEHRPPFLEEQTYQKIASSMTVDIDDEPKGWLAQLPGEIGK
jgi:hypothetical protein